MASPEKKNIRHRQRLITSTLPTCSHFCHEIIKFCLKLLSTFFHIQQSTLYVFLFTQLAKHSYLSLTSRPSKPHPHPTNGTGTGICPTFNGPAFAQAVGNTQIFAGKGGPKQVCCVGVFLLNSACSSLVTFTYCKIC